jgi:hypothetical protein
MPPQIWHPYCLKPWRGRHTLKISILDSTGQRCLVLEGTLSAPWTEELRAAWAKANADLQNRKLIVDLKNVTAITQDGENTILKLMTEGAKFRSRGVLTKHVLRELSRKHRRNASRKTSVLNPGTGEPKSAQ